MSEETKAPEVAQPLTQEQIVSDAISERGKFGEPAMQELPAKEETPEKSAEVTQEKTETQESAEESETSETTDDATTEEVEGEKEPDDSSLLDAETSEEEDKAVESVKRGMQKRIDKLTARNKEMEERLAKLEEKSKDEKPEEKKEVVYTREQLRTAMKKAVEEGDAELAFEVQEELAKMEARKLRQEYIDNQTKAAEAAKKQNQEWNSVVMHYSNDDDPSLDIRNTKSSLYQAAKDLYQDPEIGPTYLVPGGGGMLQATADALHLILEERVKRKSSSEESLNKRKELNGKKRSALGGVGAMHGDLGPMRAETTDDYINERKKSVAKLRGGF